jgi:hypothetical protein
MAVTVLYPADVTLLVGAIQCEAQLSAAVVEPSSSDTTVDLLSQTIVIGTKVSRILRIEGLQDWDAVGSICDFLYDNAGDEAEFTLAYVGGPSFAGTCQLREPAAGATASDGAKFSVELPVNEKPTRTAGALMAADEG